jgi:hypothetical protein
LMNRATPPPKRSLDGAPSRLRATPGPGHPPTLAAAGDAWAGPPAQVPFDRLRAGFRFAQDDKIRGELESAAQECASHTVGELIHA